MMNIGLETCEPFTGGNSGKNLSAWDSGTRKNLKKHLLVVASRLRIPGRRPCISMNSTMVPWSRFGNAIPRHWNRKSGRKNSQVFSNCQMSLVVVKDRGDFRGSHVSVEDDSFCLSDLLSWTIQIYNFSVIHPEPNFPFSSAVKRKTKQSPIATPKLRIETWVFCHDYHLVLPQVSGEFALQAMQAEASFQSQASWKVSGWMSLFLAWNILTTPLGGGFKYFLCSSLPGEMIQFD